MKTPKVIPALVLVLLSAAAVSATNSFFDPERIVVMPDDVRMMRWCVEQYGNPAPGVDVILQTWCRDQNGVVGCQYPGDREFPPELWVLPLDWETGLDGCANLQINTNNAPNGTTYWLTVSGELGGIEVTRETGQIDTVPEFGTIASALTLGLAGLLIWRRPNKRQKNPEKTETQNLDAGVDVLFP